MNAGIAFAGLIVGLLVGLSGIGGGSLLTPLLVLVFGMHPLAAVGSDLLSSVPTKIAGAIAHYRQRTLDMRLVLLLCAGGIPGAFTGLAILARLRVVLGVQPLEHIVERIVGVALVISAVLVLGGIFNVREERSPTPFAAPIAGFIVGVLVSMTSIGSGSLTLPALFLIAPRLGIRRLIGSDIAFAAILVPVAAAGHWRFGSVDLPVVFSLLAGSVPGVLLGSKLSAVISPQLFRPVLAGAMVLAGTRLL